MITIEQQPNIFGPAVQKLIFTASSSNVDNNGFRFRFIVRDYSTDDVIVSLLIAPSPAPNKKMFADVSPVLRLKTKEKVGSTSIHSYNANPSVNESNGEGLISIYVQIYEAWIMDGVLVQDPEDLGPINSDPFVWINAAAQIKGMYPYDASADYALTSTTSRMLSDRFYDTSKKPAQLLGINEGESRIFIPVLEKDYGVLSCITQQNGFIGGQTDMQVSLLPESGPPVTEVISSTLDFFGGLVHFGIYPANLNATPLGSIQPSAYPRWRAIYARTLDYDSNQCSATYVLYNAEFYGEHSCRYDRVRIAWANSRGGWDYFNFINKSEITNDRSIDTYKPVLGDYSSAFTMNGLEATKQVRDVTVTQKFSVNSGFITEGEYMFLRSLFLSKQVHRVNDDGTHTPIIMTETSYTEKKERRAKLNTVTFNFEIAQDYWNQ